MIQCYSTGDGTCPPMRAHWRHLANTIELVQCASFGPLESTTETANGSVQPFLQSLRQKVPILYNRRACPELPFPMGIWTSHVTRCFGPMQAHNPNGTSSGSAVFAQMTAECPYTGLPVSPSKLFLPMLASGPHGSLVHPSPERKWQLDRFSRFSRAH